MFVNINRLRIYIYLINVLYFFTSVMNHKYFQVTLSKVPNAKASSSVPGKGTKRKALSSCTENVLKKGKVTKSQ